MNEREAVEGEEGATGAEQGYRAGRSRCPLFPGHCRANSERKPQPTATPCADFSVSGGGVGGDLELWPAGHFDVISRNGHLGEE